VSQADAATLIRGSIAKIPTRDIGERAATVAENNGVNLPELACEQLRIILTSDEFAADCESAKLAGYDSKTAKTIQKKYSDPALARRIGGGVTRSHVQRAPARCQIRERIGLVVLEEDFEVCR
jgi:hypothetical protein